MKPCATWTDDCQGKKDYDGQLLSISTRYWPSSKEQAEGNHWNAFDSATRTFSSHPYEKDGRPSAHAAIHLNYGEPDENGYGDYLVVRESEFAADTQEAVKRLVEEWVQKQFDDICMLLGVRSGD